MGPALSLSDVGGTTMWTHEYSATKKAALFLLATGIALTWSASGRTADVCVVERGQDPLDVLNMGVRHNVWIVLDTSGSMASRFGSQGPTKLEAAKNVLDQLIMRELVDAAGLPLVNWGYVNYGRNSANPGTACDDQFTNRCIGLDLDGLLNPPLCGGPDNRDQIITQLMRTTPSGNTPNGISLDQISTRIVTDGYLDNLLPNQKNFVIIVTDGDDTCECSASLWDGANPGFLRSQDTTPAPTTQVATSADRVAYNAGLKGRIAYERINPTAADRATAEKGSAFVIGMGLGAGSRSRANHLAWEASGAFHNNPNAQSALFADNEEELIRALRDAFARIGIPTTEVSLGTPVVGTVKELIPHIPGMLVSDDEILGDIVPPNLDDVQHARELRSRLRNNVLFTTTLETPGFKGHLRARNVYSVSDSASSTRNADYTIEFWDAGELLQTRDPDTRTILFSRRGDPPGTPPVEFTTSNVTASDLGLSLPFLDKIGGGARTLEDAVEIVVRVIRGERLSVHPLTGTLYDSAGNLNFSKVEADGVTPTWKLLDPTNVGPAVVQNPPRSPDSDPPSSHATEYGVSAFPEGFYWEYFNRQTMVYLGTNGGMVHAFRAHDGVELFAYIPDDALGLAPGETPGSRATLKDLVALLVAGNNGIQNHQFFFAASPSVEEIFLNPPIGDGAWHTVLVFGRGKGGKFLTALDVTEIGDWDPSNPGDTLDPANRPKLLFNVGNRDELVDRDRNGQSYDGLGETWSIPVVGNVRVEPPLEDQWVLFAGGGYGCPDAGTNEGQFLYVIRMEDGTVYRRFQVPNDSSAPIDYNGLVATPTLYNPHQQDLDQLDERDFTTRVYIGDLQGRVYKLDCFQTDPSSWTFKVLYELGIDQPITAGAGVFKVRGEQLVYILLGTGGDQRVDAPFQFVAITDSDLEGANDPGTLSWRFGLDPGERVSATPVVGGQTAFFAASRSVFDTMECTRRYYSRLFALEVIGGAADFDLSDDDGTNNPLDLGEGKVTGLFFREDHLYMSRSGGIDVAGGTSVLGRKEWEPDLAQGDPDSFRIQMRGFRLSPF